MKKENIILAIVFVLLAIGVIANGFVFYFDAITFVIAGFFVILAVATAMFETICEKIEKRHIER